MVSKVGIIELFGRHLVLFTLSFYEEPDVEM
jgi:hypothetical protein